MMSDFNYNLAEIRKRYEFVQKCIDRGQVCLPLCPNEQMHQDCGYLLRQLELVYRSNELLLGAQQYSDEARAALGAELEAAEKRIEELEEFQRLVRTENDQLSDRIEELEAELHANQQSWQEHDQGRIFAAKEMQLRIEELEEAMREGIK